MIRVRELIRAASDVTLTPIADITGPSRYSMHTRLRFGIAKVARENGRSFCEIGRALGGRDHHTIIHAVSRADQLEASCPDFARFIGGLRAVAMGRAAP